MDDTTTILQRLSRDVAVIQHNSDILSQWPVSSLEVMYFSGQFFLPALAGDMQKWGSTKEELSTIKLYPGKLSNLLFYFLNERVKEKMGEENYYGIFNSIIKKILLFKSGDFFKDSLSKTWIPDWEISLQGEKTNSGEVVFLLDNLNEMISPVFRSFGVQLFFDENNVYRYYFRLGLDFNVIVVSPKSGMEIDFFEHVITPEKLTESYVFLEKGNIVSRADTSELKKVLVEKIELVKESTVFNKEYVIKQIYSAFGFKIPDEQIGFLASPFPQQIVDFYISTCQLPVEKLESGIAKIIGIK